MKGIDQLYKETLSLILNKGVESRPRNMLTRELLGHQLVIPTEAPIILNRTRKLNYAFMVAEWMWIMFGRNDVAWISAFNSRIKDFSDDGITYFGAYGPKVMNQLPYVYHKLKEDPDSRQAVISIWRESPLTTKDVPCTVSLHFVIRQQRLHCFAHMRSQDAWLGLPYDVFNFSQLTNLMAGLLKVERGNLYLTVDCLHLYQPNFTMAQLAAKEINSSMVISPSRISVDMDGFIDIKNFFNGLAVDLILKGELEESQEPYNINGISEHLDFLNSYMKKDGSHRLNSFWKGAYSGK